MTIPITIADIYKTIKELSPDPNGFVRMVELTTTVAEKLGCTEITVRNFIMRNLEYFNRKHGLIRPKQPTRISNQMEDVKIYQEWLAKKEQIIKQCNAFLATITPPSPIVEAFLVALSNSREELKSYGDDKLQMVLLDLKREYDFIPEGI